MSKDTVALNMQIPRPVHEKAKADAKASGVNLKEHIIGLIEGSEPTDQTDLITLLSQSRRSQRFGDETILEQILRRTVSMHLMCAERLAEDKGQEAADQSIARIEELTKAIIKPG